LRKEVACFIGNGVVVSPPALMDEVATLEAAGIEVRGRLAISEACPLILPHHAALDRAREAAKGAGKIGTTGRGIGPAYEDKVARRAIRMQDLFHRERLAAKLGEVLDFHNFVLRQYFGADTVDFQRSLDDLLQIADSIRPMVKDVPRLLFEAQRAQKRLLFEGAQGTLLDVDHGTYPFVTSSNCVAGAAAAGSGVGPQALHYILGITKAYTTRVGSGPFPTELDDDIGRQIAVRGNEVGATTGRPRRCGWFDAAALRRSIQINGVSGLCVTKLDVLDGMETLQIGVGYRFGGKQRDILPVGAEELAECEPIYEEVPGWSQSTLGVRELSGLPEAARRYLRRIEEVCEVPIDLISTGAERDDTIVRRHPFSV
jgi:adenylosuccinate synthase